MNGIEERALDELRRAGTLLTRDLNFKSLISVLVEQALDITKSDLACLYLHGDVENPESELKLCYKRGRFQVPARFASGSPLISFIRECGEAVLLLDRKESCFIKVLVHPRMRSGIALPVSTTRSMLGVLILNAADSDFYTRERLSFLESFTKLAGGLLHNSLLFDELKAYLRQVEELKLYQEHIFSSMTNILITTDEGGKIKYFNPAAADRFDIGPNSVGRAFNKVFDNYIDDEILRAVDSTRDKREEQLGVEGIFRGEKNEIDFSLNMSPLKGKGGRQQGVTLLFTDQTKERELQDRMNRVVEERRVIKNMFSRYLSREVVKQLMEAPNLVKPGGDKKEATILFADIRGYTAFSEDKDPEYIVEVLNKYFSRAVEIIVKYKGYIDKFIGDCIMAVWGVPLQTEKEDAIQAVRCALEIQEQVASRDRDFFLGEASGLKIGMGMHTGYLVAGNLGSARRMNYTVIGDTVNVAARLEGVAAPGEIIITQKTREFLDDLFVLEAKKPVRVKGKAGLIPIYRVCGRKN